MKAVLFATLLCVALLSAGIHAQKINGMTLASWWHDQYDQGASDRQIAKLAGAGVKSLAILVTWYQDNARSTSITRDNERTPSDAGVTRAIRAAHANGMSVLLMPVVNCRNYEWTGSIDFYDQNQRNAWFASHQAFLNHYAQIAQGNNVAMMQVGSEFMALDKYETEWRNAIGHIRSLYRGRLTYGANRGTYMNIRWWSALDFVGINAFFELSHSWQPDLNTLKAGWERQAGNIEGWARSIGKEVIFTQVGFRSSAGSNTKPWANDQSSVALQEQRDCYEATFQSVWNRSWLKGLYFWYFTPVETEGGSNDQSYTPNDKPAFQVLARYYGGNGGSSQPTNPSNPTNPTNPSNPTTPPSSGSAISWKQVPKVAGFNYASWWHDTFDQPASDQQLEALARSGGKSIAIVVTWYQPTGTSTQIVRHPQRTASDKSVIRAIRKAKSLGMSVMLKPHIDFYDATWRAKIKFDDPNTAAQWFNSYQNFIIFYARMAQQYNVEYFSIGCEFNGMERHEGQWRKLIGNIRSVYKGGMTYAANHEGDDQSSYKNVKWWDALDYIGIDAYFKLTDHNDPSVRDMVTGWNKWADEIEHWLKSRGINKHVIFCELGFRSHIGTNKAPYSWENSAQPFMNEQKNAYEATFQSVWNRPWLKGMYWWYWEPKANAGGARNADYTPQGKPSLEVVQKYFRAANTSK